MGTDLIFATVTITMALIFYTLGVFSEKKDGILKKKHLILFFLGIICDSSGTYMMSNIANGSSTGGLSLHMITGSLALLLMLFHLVWALYVYYKGDNKAKGNFHRYSLLVWVLWLVPYLLGLYIGMFS